MRYKSNYLTNVILQFQFSPILELHSQPPSDFQKRIKDRFPRTQEGQEIHLELMVDAAKATKTEVKSQRPRWQFLSDDRSAILTVLSRMFSLEFKEFKSFGPARSAFESAWRAFQESYAVEEIDRIGLRYVNQINLPSGDPLDWSDLVDEKLLAAVRHIGPPSDHKWSRSMHVAHWTAEDHNITFNFGIHNSDFPNPVARREFILDYDCSSIGSTPVAQAIDCVVRYNTVIESLFEKSIEEGLRKLMVIEVDSREANQGGGGNG